MSEETGRGWRGPSSGRNERPEEEPPPVIRDKRKFDAAGNLRSSADAGSTPQAATPPPTAAPEETATPAQRPDRVSAESPLSQGAVDEAIQLLDLQSQLDERTADLQRLSAEYANYRKRVDRDRVAVGEAATGRILEAMLPVLDDVERAAAHGDLSGPFKSVAEKLIVVLTGLGLQPFGTPGDPFDPAVHEAVMHDEDDTVEVATATSVMRQGYRLGDRLLRPAMVGVTAPAQDAGDVDGL